MFLLSINNLTMLYFLIIFSNLLFSCENRLDLIDQSLLNKVLFDEEFNAIYTNRISFDGTNEDKVFFKEMYLNDELKYKSLELGINNVILSNLYDTHYSYDEAIFDYFGINSTNDSNYSNELNRILIPSVKYIEYNELCIYIKTIIDSYKYIREVYEDSHIVNEEELLNLALRFIIYSYNQNVNIEVDFYIESLIEIYNLYKKIPSKLENDELFYNKDSERRDIILDFISRFNENEKVKLFLEDKKFETPFFRENENLKKHKKSINDSMYFKILNNN